MIRNFVFDMGQVLMDFNIPYFMKQKNVSPEDEQLLYRNIFHSLEWIGLDRGRYNEAQAVEIMCSRLPARLHDTVYRLVCEWDLPEILPVEGMADLIRELKEKGYGIFLLSNASVRQHEYWPRIPGFQYFDDTLISADVHLVKPEREIFLTAYDKFHIRPEESLFIDDVTINVECATCTGINGYVFQEDTEEFRRWLTGQGLLP